MGCYSSKNEESLHGHSSQALQMPDHQQNVVVTESAFIGSKLSKELRDATEDPA